MRNYFKDITIVIVTYKSDEIIYKFIKKIPSKIKVIVVENSKNFHLKKNLEKRYKNTKVYLRNNEGVSSSLNFGVKKTKTKHICIEKKWVQTEGCFRFKNSPVYFHLHS